MNRQALRASLPALIVAATLSGCAAQRIAPIAATAPATAIVPPRPAPPQGFSPAPTIPALSADGSYATPNAGIGAADAMWHLRAALNVAALACRGPEAATLTADYNRMLDRQRRPLAAAYAAIRTQDAARSGKGWEAAHDAQMTRLYNYFAQPFATPAFCAAAGAVAAAAGATDAAAFADAAPALLAALDAPFIDGYRRYDAYRQEAAAWDARYGSGDPATPRLAYAPVDTVLAWAPVARDRGIAVAAR